MNTKGIIKSFISNSASRMLSIIVLSILAITFKILIPICAKVAIDYSLLVDNVNDYGSYVILFIVILCVSVVLSIVCDASRQFKIVQYGNEITSELRAKAFQTIMKSEYYELNKISKDELSNNIVHDTDLIGNKYISNKLVRIYYHIFYLATVIITLFVFDLLTAIVSLVSLPILYLAEKYVGILTKKLKEKYDAANNEHQNIIDDRFSQLKIIKTRNAITEESEHYSKLLEKNKKVYSRYINIEKFKNILIPSLFISIQLAFLFIKFGANFFQNSGNYQVYLNTLGSMVGSVILIPCAVKEFKKILDIYYTKLDVDGASERLNVIYSVRVESKSETIPSLEEVHSLKFNSISFDYTGYGVKDKVALEKIDFELKKGERLGIIGLPGSGKTTIADLITKLIRPRQGNVLINNCDINKLNTYYLREIVTYISEDFNLLDTSIENNITYPKQLDEYKYNEALNKCKLKDLIFSLPDRDATNARKANLTQADIQKISLAHAFYKDSPIIILDDATSKLDSITEEDIMNEFFKLKNKISIVISSRINNIIKCDKVLIIINGKVSEYGKVEELLANKSSSLSKMVKDAHLNKKVV